jgi:hypothetical protein
MDGRAEFDWIDNRSDDNRGLVPDLKLGDGTLCVVRSSSAHG